MLQSSNFAQLFFFKKSPAEEKQPDSRLPKHGIQIGSQGLKLARLVLFGQHNVLFCFFIAASGKTRTPQVAEGTTIILIVNQKKPPLLNSWWNMKRFKDFGSFWKVKHRVSIWPSDSMPRYPSTRNKNMCPYKSYTQAAASQSHKNWKQPNVHQQLKGYARRSPF